MSNTESHSDITELRQRKTTVNDFGGLHRYAQDNVRVKQLPQEQRRAVFIGNSITDSWINNHPDFFSQNGYIDRGISGQTSYQFVVRFHADVVELKPQVVIINTATNDVAENTCPYNEDRTFANIELMVEQALANDIKVILTTTLPAVRFGWNPDIKDAPAKIERLNARIRDYAARKRLTFVDYYSHMVTGEEKALNPAYTYDGVHPTSDGYAVMESLIKPAIDKMLGLCDSQNNVITSPDGRISVATISYGRYQVLLRVMDNAVAHRFVIAEKGGVEVMDERFQIRPAEGFTAHYQTCGSFNTSYEESYLLRIDTK